MRLATGARAGSPARPAVLSPGRAQWRLLCVPARAAEGESARARGEAHARARVAAGVRPGDSLWPRGSGSCQAAAGSARAPPTWPAAPGMCEGAARGAARAPANGGGLLCVAAGRRCGPRAGEGGSAGPWAAGARKGRRQGRPVPGRRPSFRGRPGRGPVSAGPALRPGRPRFRSGKFCDAGGSGRRRGRAPGSGDRGGGPGAAPSPVLPPGSHCAARYRWPRVVVCARFFCFLVFSRFCFSRKGPRVVCLC